jgi:hypothetical protein
MEQLEFLHSFSLAAMVASGSLNILSDANIIIVASSATEGWCSGAFRFIVNAELQIG